jgi:hypothetical protein
MNTPVDEPTQVGNALERSLLAWAFQKWTDLLLLFAAIQLLTYFTLPWLRDERISYSAFFCYSVTLLVWRLKARSLVNVPR